MTSKDINSNIMPEDINAFVRQVEPQVGLSVEKFTEAKDRIFNKEEELFYRITNYRG